MTRPHHEAMDARDLLVALAINLLWGLNIIAAKMGVAATAPFTCAAIRQALVLLVCLPALKWVPGRMQLLILLGLLSGALFLCFVNLSFKFSDNVGALAIASQLGVPFSLIMAVIFLGERVHRARLAGIALAFGGVVLLVFDPAAAHELPGIALTAAGALVWSCASLLQRRLAGVPVRTIYAWIGLIGFVCMAPLAMLTEPQTVARLPELPLRSFGWILFSAVGSTVMGQGGMAWLLQRHDVATVAPLTLGAPVVAVIAASLFFGFALTPLMVAGGLIAMLGVAIITIRSARALTQAVPA